MSNFEAMCFSIQKVPPMFNHVNPNGLPPVGPNGNQVPIYPQIGMQPGVYFPMPQPMLVLPTAPPPLAPPPPSPAHTRTHPAPATTKSYRKPQPPQPHPLFPKDDIRARIDVDDIERKTRHPPQVILANTVIRKSYIDVPPIHEDPRAADDCYTTDETIPDAVFKDKWDDLEREAMRQRMEALAERAAHTDTNWG